MRSRPYVVSLRMTRAERAALRHRQQRGESLSACVRRLLILAQSLRTSAEAKPGAP